jgi:hypothetical protein
MIFPPFYPAYCTAEDRYRALPGGGRGDVLDVIVAPEAALVAKRENAAFGADAGAGEDEDEVLGREVDHGAHCLLSHEAIAVGRPWLNRRKACAAPSLPPSG